MSAGRRAVVSEARSIGISASGQSASGLQGCPTNPAASRARSQTVSKKAGWLTRMGRQRVFSCPTGARPSLAGRARLSAGAPDLVRTGRVQVSLRHLVLVQCAARRRRPSDCAQLPAGEPMLARAVYAGPVPSSEASARSRRSSTRIPPAKRRGSPGWFAHPSDETWSSGKPVGFHGESPRLSHAGERFLKGNVLHLNSSRISRPDCRVCAGVKSPCSDFVQAYTM
jgi:hypothetical protein